MRYLNLIMYSVRIFIVAFIAAFSGLIAHSAWQSAMAAQTDVDNQSAVILAYHRIDEDAYPNNALRFEDFEAHIQEIRHGGYNVMRLPDIIDAMKSGKTLPERTIALTFEGAYQSAYNKAIPLLIKARIPFTIFYASHNAERDSNEYMRWNTLKSLARYDFVTLGILPAIYTHSHQNSVSENKRQINSARLAYRENFGQEPRLFSYPFGEPDSTIKEWLQTQGFDAAFGQQSGVAHAKMDFFNIPRFVMTEGFSDIERFRMITAALPIPAYDIEPSDHFISTKTPLFGFSVPDDAASLLKTIQCFISGQGKTDMVKISERRIEIRPGTPLDDEKVRINCTANSGTAEYPQWRWFGMMYTRLSETSSVNTSSPAENDPRPAE